MLQIEEADIDADVKTGWVLDNFPKNLSQMEALQKAGILPEILFCLIDTDRNQSTRHRNMAYYMACIILIQREVCILHIFVLQCVTQF